MRVFLRWTLISAVAFSSGCFYSREMYVGQARPGVYPQPKTAQEEIRDARFFLPYPEDLSGPITEFRPPGAK